jgi:hypothetical protein
MPFEKISKGVKVNEKESENSLYFIFKNDKLLLNKNKEDEYIVPSAKNFK